MIQAQNFPRLARALGHTIEKPILFYEFSDLMSPGMAQLDRDS